jgi:hypothetical protein
VLQRLTAAHVYARVRRLRRAMLIRHGCVFLLVFVAVACSAQTQSPPPLSAAEVAAKLQQLESDLQQARADLASAQQRIDVLQRHLEELRGDWTGQSQAPANATAASPGQFPSAADLAPGKLQPQQNEAVPAPVVEDQKLLAQRVEEQQQTKVESASKYHVKISGLVLMNAYSNRGSVDITDLANRAIPSYSDGSAGATLRQTILGVQVFGPELAGAQTSANASVDFFGGVPQRPYGSTAGLVRIREATVHLDWKNTGLTVGQQTLFFSPLSPTSYATLAEPALSWAGNLWTWTPQAVLEHRFHTSDESYFAVSGGVLAALSEDPPQGLAPTPGESSRRPAVAAHAGWTSTASGHPLGFGVGAYHSNLHYNYERETDSWAVTSDWQVPIGRMVAFSGEAYRGRAVGGLGGGIWQSVVYNGDPSLQSTGFRPVNSAGGWAQIKVSPFTKWEFNLAIGQDNVFARDLRWAPVLQSSYAGASARNRLAFTNVVFRPKSILLFSGEYRYIWTYGYSGPAVTASQANLAVGVSF